MIFGYYNQPHFLVENWKERAREYLWEIFKEEGLFRILLLGILLMIMNPYLAVVISALIFGLLHFLSFRVPMVIASFILGLVLGIVFLLTPSCVFAYLVCIVIHFIVGMVAIITKLTMRWLR